VARVRLLLTFNFPLALFVTCFLGVWVPKCITEDAVWIRIPQYGNLIKKIQSYNNKKTRNMLAM